MIIKQSVGLPVVVSSDYTAFTARSAHTSLRHQGKSLLEYGVFTLDSLPSENSHIR